MQDESRPACRFQRGLCPEAPIGQLSGVCGAAGAPHAALSLPKIQPRRRWSLARRGCEFPHHSCCSSEEPHWVFLAHVGPAGCQGSAPSRSSAGTSQAVPGGGDASVLAVAAFAEQVLARRASVLGVEGKCLPGSGAGSSLSDPPRERNTRAAPRDLSCVAAEEPPGALQRGLDGTRGFSMFWDGHPRNDGSCWAVEGSFTPSLEMPLVEQRRKHVPQSLRDL